MGKPQGHYVPTLFVGGPFHGTFAAVLDTEHVVVRAVMPPTLAVFVEATNAAPDVSFIQTADYQRRPVGGIECMVYRG